MRWSSLVWLPSAALAWPVHRWMANGNLITHSERVANVSGSESTLLASYTDADTYLRQWIFGLAVLLLAYFLAGFLFQSCRRRVHKQLQDPEPSPQSLPFWVRLGSREATWQWGWLVTQPWLLAIISWPALTAPLVFTHFASTIWLISAALPTLLFNGVLSGRGAKNLSLAHMPLLVILCVGIISEAILLTLTALGDVNQVALGLNVQESTISAHVESSPHAFPLASQLYIPNTSDLVMTMVMTGLLMTMLIPVLIVWLTGAQPLDDPRWLRWCELWKTIGLREPIPLRWPTASRSSNAVFISGGFNGRLLMTDRLLDSFDEDEISLVLLHEISHARRKHYLVRLLPVLLVVPLVLWAMKALSGFTLIFVSIAILVGFLGLVKATCWWTELDADKHTIRLAQRLLGIDRARATIEYSKVLNRIYHDNRIHRTSWSHPSLDRRISAMQT